MGLLAYLLIGAAGCVAFVVRQKYLPLRRAAFICRYQFPPIASAKLMKMHKLSRKDAALVESGLRQFFLAYLTSGKRPVDMPSRIADALWHEFILCTRDYKSFCRRAFGDFLHHTPAVTMDARYDDSNEGLRRVWRAACQAENIDPKMPTRLPLLFALDSELDIVGGFHYLPGDARLGADARGIFMAGDLRRNGPLPAVTGCNGGGYGGGGHGDMGHGGSHGGDGGSGHGGCGGAAN